MGLGFVSFSEQCNPEARPVEKKIRSALPTKTIKPVENKGGLVDFKQIYKGLHIEKVERKEKGRLELVRESRTRASLGNNSFLSPEHQEWGYVIMGDVEATA